MCTDTRKIAPGCLFFALKGDNFDGNAFARKAIDSGAAYAIVDNPTFSDGDKYIVVPDVLQMLQQLANYHRLKFSIPVIAITGSNGKTTTKELITAVLSRKYAIHATVGNLNNHIGIPLTLLAMPKGTEIAIVEMGANHQREIAGYCEIAEPNYGVITNCGKAHIEGFGGEEGVRKGKGELYQYLKGSRGTIFRNVDLDYLDNMAAGITSQITYGSRNANYIGIPIINSGFAGLKLTYGGDDVQINSRLVGGYNFPNLMTAVAIGLHFKVPVSDIRDAIEGYKPGNSRSQLIQVGSNSVILDAYNANPTSMKAAILNMVATDAPNKVLWLGGMKEMGDDEQKEHAELVSLVSDHEWAHVILVGKEFADVSDNYMRFDTSSDAATYIKVHMPTNSTILIKGSRGSRMEVMLEALQ